MADSTVDCGEALILPHLPALQQELSTALAASQVTLQLGRVRRVDTAGVQLLWAFVQAAKRKQLKVNLGEIPEAVAKACQVIGVELS